MAASRAIPPGPDHVYVVPRKEITSPMDIQKWLKSRAYQDYVGFIECLNDAVRGKTQSHSIETSQGILTLVGILEKLSGWIDEIPPIDQPQRFGNKAFRDWYARVSETAESLLLSALPVKCHAALAEITVYLVESFGNSTRIDYGTGHEMAFVMFLYCVFRIGLLDLMSTDDRIGAVTKVFETYMRLVRKLQTVYRMEPAGSHGAWSLDDFQFVPFIWGSSQLFGHAQIEPQNLSDSEVIHRLSPNYMFFSCLDYTLAVKTGPFHEHSNQLWNISGTASWTKVNQGLIKMYKAEVLAKFPVIQHTFFGSLFSVLERERGAPGATPGFQVPARPLTERHVYVPNPKYPDQPTGSTLTSPTEEEAPPPSEAAPESSVKP